jgi:heat shock protein HspQ
MEQNEAKFSVGDVVHHKRFGYRGVIIDADAIFSLSDEWYDAMATSMPPKDRPWYHVLVHGSDGQTYVAERNLESDDSGEPIRHPLVGSYFEEFRDGRYVNLRLDS